jgi:uridine kinase
MACSPRAAVLDELAALIAAIDSPRPLRIVLDGRAASGETTLAGELAGSLRAGRLWRGS